MIVSRFAPSPTGLLHLGHAFSALTAAAGADRFLVRIEDLDHTRCRPAYEAAILEDLAWLGLRWETPVRRQSAHMAEYGAALRRLIEAGVAYRCFRTRRELAAESAHAPHGAGDVVRGGPAPDDAERLARGDAFAWRLWLDRCRDHLGARWDALGFEADGVWVAADPGRLGDAVIARKDFPASYHIASVWDDALQGVTHVVRGEDLREAAHLHVLLQALLELPTPRYRHHRLILGPDGKRLAKRDHAATLRSLRESGFTAQAVRAMVGL
ncbi:MAG: tRNA glutamyl-Q(34) synthetase GluQRS [Hyphomonadaceae bacterium]|nr:tRNA glutamyl-Q(34) synthetase GluQRS [Hyphomonadaceae bacterium]